MHDNRGSALCADKAGDGQRYYAADIRNREHLAEYESGNVSMHLKNKARAKVVVRELAADWVARKHFFIGIFEQTTDELAGQIYVGPTNWDLSAFTIGYVADVEHEGKGYILEAVRQCYSKTWSRSGWSATATSTMYAVGGSLNGAGSSAKAIFVRTKTTTEHSPAAICTASCAGSIL